MTAETKEKLIQRINSGQSLKMLCWEFNINKTKIIEFAKENSLILRTRDFLNYAHKVNKKYK